MNVNPNIMHKSFQDEINEAKFRFECYSLYAIQITPIMVLPFEFGESRLSLLAQDVGVTSVEDNHGGAGEAISRQGSMSSPRAPVTRLRHHCKARL